MSKILLVVEGFGAEQKYWSAFENYLKSIRKSKGNTEDIVKVEVYGTCIYDLYKRYCSYEEGDEPETLLLLREILEEKRDQGSQGLSGKDFSYLSNIDKNGNITESFEEIYLMFDLDAHTQKANANTDNGVVIKGLSEKITKMLNHFNDSTGAGLLLLSYPQVESLKCFDDSLIDLEHQELILHSHQAVYDRKSGTQFKKSAKAFCSEFNSYNHTNYCTKEVIQLIKYYILCTVYLSENNKILIESEEIFEKQKEKFLCENQVLLLSAFPQFLLYFLGIDIFFETSQLNASFINENWTFECVEIS